jgi:hypothetical protein
MFNQTDYSLPTYAMSMVSHAERQNPVLQRQLGQNGLKKFVVKLDVSNPILIMVVRTALAWVFCSPLQPGRSDGLGR